MVPPVITSQIKFGTFMKFDANFDRMIVILVYLNDLRICTHACVIIIDISSWFHVSLDE